MLTLTNIKKIAAILLMICFVLPLSNCESRSKQVGTGEYFDDSVITANVKAVIHNEPTLKLRDINVETFKGIVQLSGFVASQADMNKTVEVARRVKGVNLVKNELRIK